MVVYLQHPTSTDAAADTVGQYSGTIVAIPEPGPRKRAPYNIHLSVGYERHHNLDTGDPLIATPDSGYATGIRSSNKPFFEDEAPHNEYYEEESPRIFAFVVAVDKYSAKNVSALYGCKNDAEDFIDFLEKDLYVPAGNITRLYDENATRAAIIDTFRVHFSENNNIGNGDALIFFFSGHGASAPAPVDWPAERGQIELLCPYDYDPNGRVHGIPDRTLDGLMRELASRKGDNITAILDCCHAGGMDRELSADEERVRGVPLSTKPVPRDLDQNIWGPTSPSSRAVTFEPISGVPYKALASHVTLAACQPSEKAKERPYPYGLSRGGPTRSQVRGVFSVNLISMLRAIGKRGLQRMTYARLMDDLLRRDGASQFVNQHPQCEGSHRNRALFSMRSLLDAPDSFILFKAGNHWRVQAGTIHGITKGTQFSVPRVAGRTADLTRGTELTLSATAVTSTACEVQGSHAIPDSLDHTRVLVTDWNRTDALATNVLVKDAFMVTSLTPALPSTGTLYHVTRDGHVYDVILDAFPHQSGGWRITRFDPLVTHFCNSSRRALDIHPDAMYEASDLLNAVSRFNFHLYRFNPDQGADETLKLTVQLHLLERLLDGAAQEVFTQIHLSPQCEVLLHQAINFLTAHHSGDIIHHSGIVEKAHSNFKITKSVMEAMVTETDKRFGFTLINESEVDLFPYVFHFDPDTYAITKWYAPQYHTCEAPLPAKGRLSIGYGGSGTDPMSFARSKQANLGFLKVFVSTRYVELNIEQPSVFDRRARDMHPVDSVPQVNPHVKGAHFEHVPMMEQWNAWIYVLTSNAATKYS